MGERRIAAAACCVFGLVGIRSAHAEDDDHTPDTHSPDPTRLAQASDEPSAIAMPSLRLSEGRELDFSYLYDGGAIPFIWVPLAGRIFMDTQLEPRATPLMFPAGEGGASKPDWEIPGWGVTALGGVSALGMIASGDKSRFYHVKGLAESLSTGVFLTGAVKVIVGRHRPDWSEDTNTPGSRRSFPSGHSTQAWAIATYTALYLRGHVFDKYRGDSVLPWYEALTYGGIAAAAVGLSGERVVHNKHHLSDVAIGGLVGSATSALFYWYQDSRYDKRKRAEERKQLVVTPATHGEGATVGLSWMW
jgi:membrane-associated phospholipid phosphatase